MFFVAISINLRENVATSVWDDSRQRSTQTVTCSEMQDWTMILIKCITS